MQTISLKLVVTTFAKISRLQEVVFSQLDMNISSRVRYFNVVCPPPNEDAWVCDLGRTRGSSVYTT